MMKEISIQLRTRPHTRAKVSQAASGISTNHKDVDALWFCVMEALVARKVGGFDYGGARELRSKQAVPASAIRDRDQGHHQSMCGTVYALHLCSTRPLRSCAAMV